VSLGLKKSKSFYQKLDDTHESLQKLDDTQGSLQKLDDTQGSLQKLDDTEGSLQKLDYAQGSLQKLDLSVVTIALRFAMRKTGCSAPFRPSRYFLAL
jgi:hypothetical protein